MILPGATLGVIGGGQLGRMFAVDALRMGYRVVVLDPDQRSPTGLIASYHICAPFDDQHALDEMIELCDAITIEFENIPVSSLEYIEKRVPLSPSVECVRIAQDRLLEKNFFLKHGLATPAFSEILKIEDIGQAIDITATPCIIKTAKLGYDGKGQAVCYSMSEVTDAFLAMGGVPCILEQRVNLKTEVSVIIARGQDGRTTVFPVAENEHTNGILDITTVPAQISDALHAQALSLATRLATNLSFVGILAVELFVSESDEVMINEIAPRPHNSGHFTQNATRTSQFEQQVRMMCGLPAGSPELTDSVTMLNLLGDLWGDSQPDWSALFKSDNSYLHLYAKHEARPGRKMGHVNLLGTNVALLKTSALALKENLRAI